MLFKKKPKKFLLTLMLKTVKFIFEVVFLKPSFAKHIVCVISNYDIVTIPKRTNI